jgi:hypothetical protein
MMLKMKLNAAIKQFQRSANALYESAIKQPGIKAPSLLTNQKVPKFSPNLIEHHRWPVSPQLVTCAIPGLVYYIGSGVEQFSSV